MNLSDPRGNVAGNYNCEGCSPAHNSTGWTYGYDQDGNEAGIYRSNNDISHRHYGMNAEDLGAPLEKNSWSSTGAYVIVVQGTGTAFGLDVGNHAFVVGARTGDVAETNTSSGRDTPNADRHFNGNMPFSFVSLPKMMSEEVAIEKIENKLDKGLYVPFINDCHSQLRRGMESSGIHWPGVEGGRVNDDYEAILDLVFTPIVTPLGVGF